MESMNLLKKSGLALIAGLLITSTSRSQPPAPITGGGVATTVATGTTAAPNNLWSFLCMTPEQKMACKTCFCNSPIGQMTSAATAPLSLMSGGLITNRCAANQIASDILNNPADSSAGAAARIKKDEADAAARRQAVRYLGTVDCSRWPEAEAALINALRGDRNECVRLEAALALRNGCCCTTKIRRALEMTIIGKADKFPAERSERVKLAAADALAHCGPEEEPIFEGPAPIPETIKKASLQTAMKQYANQMAPMQTVEPISNSRGLLVLMQQRFNVQAANASIPTPVAYQRPGSLSEIVANAFNGPPARPELQAPTRPMVAHEMRPITPMPTAPTHVDWRPASQLPMGPITPTPMPTFGQPREASGWVTIETTPTPAQPK
jgi:hypothetical protein